MIRRKPWAIAQRLISHSLAPPAPSLIPLYWYGTPTLEASATVNLLARRVSNRYCEKPRRLILSISDLTNALFS